VGPEADIVVVGSGVGAARRRRRPRQRRQVIALDKAPIPGGTSSKSAGVLWVPNNFTLKAKGIDDAREDCLRFMARFSYPERYNASEPYLGLSARACALLEAFYDNSSAAVDRLRGSGALNVAEWRMFALDRSATDYLDDVPENKVPAGRTLGAVKADGKVGAGVDLMAQLNGAMRQRGIPLLLNHRAMRLVMDEGGRAIGVEAEAAGKVVTLRARKALIFATGGYVHNPEFVENYQRNWLYGSCAMPWATGDFINIAGAAGCAWATCRVPGARRSCSRRRCRARSWPVACISRRETRCCRSVATGGAR
jgi:succinate dehydrogenase/fumarate reductase flavoprotein subunit